MPVQRIPPPFGPGSPGWKRTRADVDLEDCKKLKFVSSGEAVQAKARPPLAAKKRACIPSPFGKGSGYKSPRSQGFSPIATRAHSVPGRDSPNITAERRNSLCVSPSMKSKKMFSPDRRSTLCMSPKSKSLGAMSPDRRGSLCMSPSKKSGSAKSLAIDRRDSLCISPAMLPQTGGLLPPGEMMAHFRQEMQGEQGEEKMNEKE